MLNAVSKSGVGKAIEHQMTALSENNIPFTTNKKENFDLVHINTILPDSFFMSLISRLKGKTIVYHAHSTMEDFKNSFKGSNFFAPFFKFWIILCYSQAHLLLTPTPYSKSLLENYGLKKEIIPISNGIDIGFYKNAQEKREEYRKKYGFSSEDKVIISVGHYMERKGITDFVKLAKEMPEYKFIWFGYTPDMALTANVAKAIRSVPKNLQFPGYINSDELKYAYGASDLFLFMSNEETEGIVVLEALASKIPVLVRNIPVYDKWLEDGKNVYKADNFSQFKEKTTGILTQTLPSTVLNGYKTAEERSIKSIGKKLYSAYCYAHKINKGEQND